MADNDDFHEATTVLNQNGKKARDENGDAMSGDWNRMKDEILADIRAEIRREVRAAVKDVVSDELKSVVDELKGLKETTSKVLGRVEKLEGKVTSVNDVIKRQTEEVKAVREEVSSVKKEVNEVKDEIAIWKGRVGQLEDMMIDQQARSMRNNLMIHGMEELGGKEDCEKMVRDLIVDKCGVTGAVRLERVHRIPTGERPAGSKPRPMIAKFLDFKDKQNVKRNAKNLPRGIKVSDDLPKEIRIARKMLVPDLERAKAANKDAFIVFPARLIVDKVEVKAIRPSSVMEPSRHA